MRLANILTGLAGLLWFGLFLLGWDLMKGLIARGVLGYPNVGQIEGYVVWPALVVMALTTCAWVCNGARRWPRLLLASTGVSLAALLPFLFAYTGGV